MKKNVVPVHYLKNLAVHAVKKARRKAKEKKEREQEKRNAQAEGREGEDRR